MAVVFYNKMYMSSSLTLCNVVTGGYETLVIELTLCNVITGGYRTLVIEFQYTPIE